MPENPSEINHIEFTKVIANHRLTKQIVAVDANGRVTSGDAPLLSGGQFERIRLPLDNWQPGFLDILAKANSYEALILAPPNFEGEGAPITTRSALEAGATGRTRSRDNFDWPPSAPALFGLDFDRGQAPADRWADTVSRGVVNLVTTVAPEAFEGVGAVSRPSSSSHVRDHRSGGTTGERGRHALFVACDPSGIPLAVRTLSDRLILAGHGHAHIAKNGRASVRSPIDTGASIDGSRLWFIAAPALSDPALTRDAEKCRARGRTGRLFDCSLVRALDAAEQARLDEIKQDLLATVASEATRVAEAHRADNPRAAQVAEHPGAGRNGVPEFVLTGSHELRLDDGRIVRTIDLLLDPAGFDGARMSDPEEWDYGGGHNLARAYLRGPAPRIESLAHGGRRYWLRLDADDLVALAGQVRS